MNVIQQGIITLLRSAITGQTLALPEGFSLEAADGIIRAQSLLPMAYLGAHHCGMDPNSELMREYRKEYLHFMLRSEQQMHGVEQLYAAFEENGIDYLPMKGCILKKLYPQPEMRTMGDADILIRMEQYEKIKQVMQKLQYQEDVESPYDFHWIGTHLLVELHKRLFGENQKDICLYFDDGWSKAVHTSGHRYDMSVEDTYVYIFSHMTKHFRFCGIGARQIVDLYVYQKAHPEMKEDLVEQTMEKIYLLDFYRNIRKLLAVWFEGEPTDPVTDYITTYVFNSGSFGTMENKMYSEEVIRSKSGDGISDVRAKSLLRTLFPTLDNMQLSYNILYKVPALYPFFWVVRLVDVLLHRAGNIPKKMKIIWGISDEKVIAHQQALNYMGLDFYYEEAEQEMRK